MLLFITADDFGYCPQRNIGIIDCFGSRGITDASLMVNATYAKEAADLGLKHGLPMGVYVYRIMRDVKVPKSLQM